MVNTKVLFLSAHHVSVVDFFLSHREFHKYMAATWKTIHQTSHIPPLLLKGLILSGSFWQLLGNLIEAQAMLEVPA